MARRTYGWTDETHTVLSRHESGIAGEMVCDPTYIFAIKNRKEHAPFVELFRAASCAGAPAHVWLNRLNAIWLASRRAFVPAFALSAKLLEKIKGDAEAVARMVDVIGDGILDERECYEILEHLKRNARNNEQLREIVLHHLGEIGEAKGK